MTAASRSLATALWRARFASGLLRPTYTTKWDTTQHSMLLCMIASFRAAFDVPRRRRSKTYHALDSPHGVQGLSEAYRRLIRSETTHGGLGCIVRGPTPRAGQNPISLAGFDVERT